MIEIRCDFCGTKTAKEFNHKVEIKPWYNPRVAGHVYRREFDCCEECAKAIEHRLITIENNYLWRGKDPNRRYKNWFLSIERNEAKLKADMVAMLEDLDLQIDESAAYNLEVAKVQRLIRDRIDKLKGDKK